MKLLIFVTLLFIVEQTASVYFEMRKEWEAYKTKYNRVYETEIEEEFRMKIYVENALSIARHNKLYAEGKVGYKQGINKFADMLPHEIFEKMQCLKPDTNETLSKIKIFRPHRYVKVPDEVDWRKEGAVTPVKDQHMNGTSECGSCYAFATVISYNPNPSILISAGLALQTGAVESQHFIVNNKLVSLSEQNIVDCSKGEEYGNGGCEGGTTGGSFHYIIDNKGVDTEESYPYLGIDNETCRYDPANKGATITGINMIPSGNEDILKQVVGIYGPVTAGIDAHHSSFHYFEGKDVYYEPECSSTNLTHAVLVVGYGTTEDGEDYWLIKNSWGTKWGDEGYFKLARNRNNHCGVATTVIFPKI